MPQVSIVADPTDASRDEAQPPFVCAWKAAGLNAAWILLAGEFQHASSAQLKETLREAQHHARVLVLDLRRLTLIDSSGVYVVLNAACGARREGGRVMLVRGPPQVDRLFTLIAAPDEVLIVDLDPTQPAKELLDLDRPACGSPPFRGSAPEKVADHAVGREEARRLRDLFARSPVVRLFGPHPVGRAQRHRADLGRG